MFPPSSDVVIPPAPSRRPRLGIGSLAISIFLHGVLLTAGVIWIFKIVPDKPHDVAFPLAGQAAENSQPKKPKAASPQMDLSRVAALGLTSEVALPVPKFASGMNALSALGSGSMTGGQVASAGGAFQGSAMVPGTAGAHDSIFSCGEGIRPQRIAYVLDFSMTMVGEKDRLMRHELEKALKALPGNVQYSVICFSGPVWLPGDEVNGKTVRSGGKTYEWSAKSMWEWTASPPMIKAPWIEASSGAVKKTLALVEGVKSNGGTDWEAPLEVAIAMEPPPEAVFFLTDGIMEQRDMLRLTRNIAAKAKSRKVVVNTVSMMEPGAEAPMADLARRTGGRFTIIDQSGRIKKAPAP